MATFRGGGVNRQSLLDKPHDMEAGTTWTEVTHSFPRSDQRLWVSQVGGNGSSCGGASGPEPSSGTAEVQTGDHNDPGQ